MTGFGFSSPPTLKRTWTSQDVARLNNKVMIGLGFGERGYVAQGGDLGAVVTNWAALNHAECKGSSPSERLGLAGGGSSNPG